LRNFLPSLFPPSESLSPPSPLLFLPVNINKSLSLAPLGYREKQTTPPFSSSSPRELSKNSFVRLKIPPLLIGQGFVTSSFSLFFPLPPVSGEGLFAVEDSCRPEFSPPSSSFLPSLRIACTTRISPCFFSFANSSSEMQAVLHSPSLSPFLF